MLAWNMLMQEPCHDELNDIENHYQYESYVPVIIGEYVAHILLSSIDTHALQHS